MIHAYTRVLNRNLALIFACLSILAGCDDYWSDERCEEMKELLDVVDGDIAVSEFKAKDFKETSSDSTVTRGDYTISLVGIEESNLLNYSVVDNDTPNQVLIDITSGLRIDEVVPSNLWEESAFAAKYTETAKRLSCDGNLTQDEKAVIATVSSTAIGFWTPLAEPVGLFLSTELRIIILIERDNQDATLGRLIHEKNGELHQVYLYGGEATSVLASLGLTAVTNR